MTIDRSQFLPPNAVDADLPVPMGENCSVPSARMAYLLAGLCGTGDAILEIGTGSGYQTAILAERFKSVVSLESYLVPGVAGKLPSNVALIQNVDGLIYSTGEVYDALLVTFAVQGISAVWVEQLKIGGKLVVPIQVGEFSCRISVYEKTAEDVLILDEIVAYAPFTQAQHIH